MYDIISLGAATIDIFVKSQQFCLVENPKETSQKFISLPYSSKSEISQGLICSGGGATNSSVAFSRLGLKTACVARTGNDYLYPIIASELKKESVTNLISVALTDATDYSIILVANDGGRSILTNRGGTSLTQNDINWTLLKDTKWLYISSIEGNMDLLENLIGFARENDIKISLNPGNRELSQLPRLLPLLPYVDFLLLNTTESQTLLKQDFNDNQFLDKLISLGPGIASVTNGREGAYIITSEDKYYSPIINTTPVDETGAGDSFGSAFVAALIANKHPQEALRWAVKNSASVVSRLGAKPGLLTLEQIA